MARLEADDCSSSMYHRGKLNVSYGSYGVGDKADSGVGESLREDVAKMLFESVISCGDQEAATELTDTDACDSAVFVSNVADIASEISKLDITDIHSDVVNSPTAAINDSSHCTSIRDVEELAGSHLLEELFLQDEDGDTKLHLAIIHPNVAVATWMTVAAVAGSRLPSSLLDIQNYSFRQTPLHLAVVTNQPQLVRVLVVCGAELNVRDFEGNTPMHLACSRGYMSCIEALASPVSPQEQLQLIQYSQMVQLPTFTPPVVNFPDFYCLDYEGRSFVHLVQSLKQPDRLLILNFLVQLHCSQLDIQDGKSGQTVLHLAVKQNDKELLHYLLCNAEKLNINQQDYSGRTALDIASRLKLHDIANYLDSRGARHSDSFGLSDDPSDDSSDDDDMADYDDLTVGGQRLHTASCH